MRNIFAFVAVFAFLILPLVSFAAAPWTPGDPIVPQEVIDLVTGKDSTPQDVQACHLVLLVDNLVRFAVFFSTIVATVMFAYAGILYVTASARADNLNQAKTIFGKVFLGFVFILGAWLIIDILLSVLTEEKRGFAFWSNIQCVEDTRGLPPTSVQIGGDSGVIAGPAPIDSELEGAPAGYTTVAPTTPLDHDAVITKFDDGDVHYTSTSGPDGVQRGCTGDGCTSFQDMREATADTTVNLQQACATASSGCQITVTGGTEGDVHRPGSVSHETGYKIDYDDDNQGFNDFIEKNPQKFRKIDTNTYRDTCGNTFRREPDHWDATIIQKCNYGG